MLQDILTAKKALFATGAHTELRGQKNRNRRVVLLNGDVRGNVRSDVSGVSARVYRGGVYGFSSMAEYTEDAAETVLKAATENAAFMDQHAGAGKPELPRMPCRSVIIGAPDHVEVSIGAMLPELGNDIIGGRYPGGRMALSRYGRDDH